MLRFHGFLVLRHRRGFVVAGRPMGGGATERFGVRAPDP
jgi:hypothetical protein